MSITKEKLEKIEAMLLEHMQQHKTLAYTEQELMMLAYDWFPFCGVSEEDIDAILWKNYRYRHTTKGNIGNLGQFWYWVD